MDVAKYEQIKAVNQSYIHPYFIKEDSCKKTEIVLLNIPKKLLSEIVTLSKSRGTSPSQFILSVYQILLYRYSGIKNINVSLSINEKNSSIVTLKLNPQMIFNELVDKSKKCDGSSLYYMLSSKNEAETLLTKFDLILDDSNLEQGTIRIIYNCEKYEENQIKLFKSHFLNLIKQILNKLDTSISELDFFTKKENKIYSSLSNNNWKYPNEIDCIHHLIEKQAKTYPNKIAVVFQKNKITYKELNDRADLLAQELMIKGVIPETIVGLCVDRSIEMIIGLLAILKSGGAYLPIDPAFPKDRIQTLINESKMNILISESKLVNLFDEYNGTRLNIDEFPFKQLKADKIQLFSTVNAKNAAYVIFTSGSTGIPKGVVIEHRNLIHYVQNAILDLGISSSNNMATVSTLAADVGNTVIFPSLCVGACLHIVPRDTYSNPDKMGQYMQYNKIDFLKIVPSHLSALLTATTPSKVLPKKQLVLGGESLKKELVEKILNIKPKLSIVQSYGPTETTVAIISEHVNGSHLNYASPIPLGKPMNNNYINIVNKEGLRVPLGIPGELLIGGAGVSRGYFKQNDLTKQKFIEQAYGNNTNKLYCTGDLVRFLSNGKLEFLGRIDNQVKIRGYRVEIDEIENSLLKHEEISQVVVIKEKSSENLTAYIVLKDQKETIVDDVTLLNFLKEKLPDYMIPNSIKVIDKMPLNENGKIDKSVLLTLNCKNKLNEKFISENATEELLFDLWSTTIGNNNIKINDTFIEVGGNSIHAIELIAKIKKIFNYDFRVTDFINGMTIYKQAEKLSGISKKLKNPLKVKVRSEESYEGNFPISPYQKSLWAFEKLNTKEPVYNLPILIELKGNLDIDNLNNAIKKLIIDNPILTSNFSDLDGEPFQYINISKNIELDILNCRDVEIRDVINQKVRMPFDLYKDNLIRFNLYVINDNHSKLLINIHHIISDGRSNHILIKQLKQSYSGEKVKEKDISMQYIDYVVWQHKLLEKNNYNQQLDYWKHKLANTASVLKLPFKESYGDIQKYEGSAIWFQFNDSLTKKIRDFSKKNGCTPYLILLTAYKALLARYTKQEDIYVGTPVTNRGSENTHQTIGYFVNTLILRTEINTSENFISLLNQVRNTVTEALDNQEIPFEMIAREIPTKRYGIYTSLLQTYFAYQTTPNDKFNFGELSAERLEIDTGIAKFPLTLSFKDSLDKIKGNIEYNSVLFEESIIKQFLKHFNKMLEELIDNPKLSINHIDFLDTEDKHTHLNELKGPQKSYPINKTIHQLFEEQVKRHPNKIALIFQEIKLTYKEVNEYSNQMAYYLREKGVKQNTKVGLCLEKSPEMIISVLAIIKAGAAYVPLDPQNPIARLKYIIKDSGIKFMVTENSLVDELNIRTNNTILIDNHKEAISKHPIENLSETTNAENPIYVIYTSGTTGNPKGVVIPHKALVNHNYGVRDSINLTQEDNVLQFRSISFDVAAEEIFPTLLTGSTLVVLKNNNINYLKLNSFIEYNKISVINLPTAYWHDWIYELYHENISLPKTLRIVIAGGEKIDNEKIDMWNKVSLGSNAKFIIAYGPTETTISMMNYHVKQESFMESNIPNGIIGSPLTNTEVLVLDENLQMIPQGSIGELYIGGIGLALGYLNRPSLTEEKFVQNPYKSKKELIFKTGDLVKYRSDGNIQFIGRTDNQVKIRGFRIELDEIKSVLLKHSSVNDAVVIINREDINKGIVAYVVSKNKNTDSDDLKNYINRILPKYMVPDDIVFLKKFHKTTNGKIDFKSLPKPLKIRKEKRKVLPKTAIEIQVNKLWIEILNNDDLSIEDDFFTIGGHSLAAIKLATRIQNIFNIDFQPKTIFEKSTIKAMSEEIESILNDLLVGKKREVILSKNWNNKNIPLSSAQKRLWFIDKLEGNSSLYNVPVAMNLKGEKLNICIIKEAINKVIKRHKILNVSILEKGGEPYQFFNQYISPEVTEISMGKIPNKNQETQIKDILKKEFEKPFNLSQPPLIRFVLIELSDNEFVLGINIHHIISDGWSMEILFDEITDFCDSKILGISSRLKTLPIQYFDYADWQQKNLEKPYLIEQLKYWKEKIGENPPVLNLPNDYPRPAIQSFEGSNEEIKIPKDLYNKFNSLSASNGASKFMGFLSIFNLLLHTYTEQEKIIVGIPIVNRNKKEIENLIGLFVNTIALKSEINYKCTFEEILKQVKTTVTEGFLNQDIPFEKVVEELNPIRDLSYSPIFQVMFQINAENSASLGSIKSKQIEIDFNKAKVDLSIDVNDYDNYCVVKANYNKNLFSEELIKRMLKNFKNIMQTIVLSPDVPIEMINFIDKEERKVQLFDWNQTKIKIPNKPVHILIEEQADLSPNKIAVIDDKNQLSYKELNDQSNQLANYLMNCGFGSNNIIGFYMNKSVNMIVVILGILKAGGSYLPLDSNSPKERLDYIISDAEIDCIITEQKVEGFTNYQQISLFDKKDLIKKESIKIKHKHESISTTAYVIYTSGSTGKPKGVLINHRGLINHSTFIKKKFEITANDIVGQFMSIAFDFAAEEIFPTLLSGATLCILDNKNLDYLKLNFIINKFKLTLLHLPTAYWKEWVTEINISRVDIPKCLRLVNVGGEKNNYEKVLLWDKLNTEGIKLVDSYGPSETTITSILYEHDPKKILTDIPIGRPIDNTEIYILNKYKKLLPIGVPGELFIGGYGVASGYLNNPQLTLEKFINNPFTDINDCLYKTGDIVRYKQDGNIEFLGRIDDQIKIRGFRVELGEIESVILKYPDIKNAIILNKEDKGNQFLVAYIITDQKEKFDALKFKKFLELKLPEYMIPSFNVLLDELPLTVNGKVDRHSLPEPGIETNENIQPKNQIENQIFEIWQEILGTNITSTKDNFFKCGGHSLLALKVISRLKQLLKIDLSVRLIFEFPTIQDLAKKIKPLLETKEFKNISELQIRMKNEEIPLTFNQESIWTHHQMSGDKTLYNVPIIYRISGKINIKALEVALNNLIKRHEILRTNFVEKNGELLQIINDNLKISLNAFKVDESDRSMLEKLIKDNVLIPFNLEKGPLVRVYLLELNESNFIFTLNMHHIICDGTSVSILMNELGVLYNGLIQAKNNETLTPLPFQYADYAKWQRKRYENGELDSQIKYWSNKVEEESTSVIYPVDKDNFSNTFRGEIIRQEFPIELYNSLKRHSFSEESSVFMTLVTGIYSLLYISTGIEKMTIGTLLDNRDKIDVENMIGYFINTVVLNGDLQGNPTFNESLNRVKNSLFEVYSNKDLPLEKILEMSNKLGSSKNQLFNILFELQTIGNTLNFTGLFLDSIQINLKNSKFPLSIAVIENDNDSVILSIEYNTDLYNKKTIEDFIENYIELLKIIITNPNVRLMQLKDILNKNQNISFEEIF